MATPPPHWNYCPTCYRPWGCYNAHFTGVTSDGSTWHWNGYIDTRDVDWNPTEVTPAAPRDHKAEKRANDARRQAFLLRPLPGRHRPAPVILAAHPPVWQRQTRRFRAAT